MEWFYYAFFAWLVTGISFLLLKNVNTSVKNNLMLQYIYILIALIISGFFSFIMLGYLLFKKNTNLKYIKTFSKLNILLLGIIIFLSYIFIMFAGIKGGTPAFQIINLNIIISALGGYFLYKEKLSITKIIGIIIALFGASIIISSK